MKIGKLCYCDRCGKPIPAFQIIQLCDECNKYLEEKYNKGVTINEETID